MKNPTVVGSSCTTALAIARARDRLDELAAEAKKIHALTLAQKLSTYAMEIECAAGSNLEDLATTRYFLMQDVRWSEASSPFSTATALLREALAAVCGVYP